MKYTKQILEAINRGIKLALDDFEDDIQDQKPVLSKKRVQNYDAKDDFDFYNMFIDLGLPSGTLWCKYNLGANIDKIKEIEKKRSATNTFKELYGTNPYSFIAITENPEFWYGNYYAWGETKEKEKYDWEHYKWCVEKQNQLTKYCNYDQYGYHKFQDNLMQLLPEDDPVTQTFGFGYHMPTEKQMNELLDNTNYEMVEDFEFDGLKIKGLNGLLCKSKVNNNYVFFPMAGWKSFKNTTSELAWHDKGSYCQMWLADLDKTSSSPYANCLGANLKLNDGGYTGIAVYQTLRCWGLPVRPVFNR